MSSIGDLHKFLAAELSLATPKQRLILMDAQLCRRSHTITLLWSESFPSTAKSVVVMMISTGEDSQAILPDFMQRKFVIRSCAKYT